jgi:signal transduction histidine kinase/ActR/RegA family two-component response regulator
MNTPISEAPLAWIKAARAGSAGPGAVLFIAGVLFILTYLLVPLASPNIARHDRTFDALHALFLNEAALQRDVLRARSGLLRNYDPLVQSVDNLRQAVDILRSDAQHFGVEPGDAINQGLERVAAALADQERLVERFKSRNALLQNSLSFFAHTLQQFNAGAVGQQGPLSADVGAVANAMLRFINDPDPGNGDAAMASLSQLAQSPSNQSNPAQQALVSHGRLIVTTLPTVDHAVSRLVAPSTRESVAALQAGFMDRHASAVVRASNFGKLLYAAAIALAVYVGYLFLRLRANARRLQRRLDTERAVAAISAPFINLPRHNTDAGINAGIERLAEHVGLDRVQVVVPAADKSRIETVYGWHQQNSAKNADPAALLQLALQWSLPDHERQGCIQVIDTEALPDSTERSRLRERRVRSWLCVPMWYAGKRVGFLSLDAISQPRSWDEDDIAFARSVAEILGNAIESRRSELERQALETRLQQGQRLESIGTLAGGIAHEFNNILGAMLGYAELTQASLKRGSRAERHVQKILRAGARAQAVIHKVLAFGRRSERRPRRVLAERAVREAVELLRASLPATISIETRYSSGNAAVLADPTELQQVVMNLCTNGAHAMNNEGTLHLDLSTIDVPGELALSHGNALAGRYVRLAVRDTGSGMDAATLDRILEPFFTTKAAGQGTGLGLSTVHGIITEHGGALNVQSLPGRGSTFEAYFPHAGEGADEQDTPTSPAVLRGHGQTILLVDDDASLVPLAEEMLAALGYEAVGFSRSAAALEAFRISPDRFDLVLTDDIMPEMTGTELAGALHEIRPTVPIILMTGGGRPTQAERLQVAGIREVVKKPLLSAAIADLLARYLPSPMALAEESRQ